MEIDWSKAPDWARYCAMDGDGMWCWYEVKPECKAGSFWVDESDGMWKRAYLCFKPQLQERPQ